MLTPPSPDVATMAQDEAAMPCAKQGNMVPRKRINSQALLGNEREIEIEHSGQLYRLRLTAMGKLILTK